MSNRRKEAEEKMAKAIFISADCWLCVFDLLSPRQLGLRISMISHRFDLQNGTKEMEIGNFRGKAVPIPQIQMPRKVNGFESIKISFIDQNTIAFLHRFRPIFAACPINLSIHTNNDRILDMIVRNIWPMLEKTFMSLNWPAHFSIICVNSSRQFSTIVHHLAFSIPILTVSSLNSHAMTVPRHGMDKRWPNGFSLRFKTMCQSCSNARCMVGIGRQILNRSKRLLPMLHHPPISLLSFRFVCHFLLTPLCHLF
ncbi:hypothetical protein niasHT_005607 [Heterodera trifolii]|uniref:Uncharacterized protein n=1 Tax=Heterodera trifolii TaxID=157864 RepID=A0ABD2MBG5_9BILA